MPNPKSRARLKVCYSDGSWTHDLFGDRFAMEVKAERITLRIRLAKTPEGGALDEFLEKCDFVDTIQIGRTAVRKLLMDAMRKAERPELSVALTAGRKDVTYPSSVTFGPDAITLSLG
jgi:hypothetical protein